MRLHILQHVAFEGPAAIADWAALQGHTVSSTHYFAKGWKHPALADIDGLVVMGGPMGVHDGKLFEWLSSEMDFVKSAIEAGKKVLGVCLGAQIIAHVLGGKVFKNQDREIGWFPLKGDDDWFPNVFSAFHWHGETFTLPAGARHLCSTPACENQAFSWQERVLALQFHLETTEASAEAMLVHAASDLSSPGVWVQDSTLIRSGTKKHSAGSNRILFQILDRWSAS